MPKGTSQKQNKKKDSGLNFEAQLWAAADSFRADLHPDLKADFILANPPFNMSDWGGENLRQDVLKVPPISQHANVNEIIGKFGGADQLLDAVSQLQSLLYAA